MSMPARTQYLGRSILAVVRTSCRGDGETLRCYEP